MLTGYRIRLLAALLSGYVMLLALLFYHNWSDQMTFGLFISHLGLSAALLHISAYGARTFSLYRSAHLLLDKNICA